jgi:hypothetical protein
MGVAYRNSALVLSGDLDVFVYNQKGSTQFESSLWFNQE